ncbi:hypothetical protein AQUCO_00200678v1 [Aquilegia coerulea]|uniref:Large ribosomal subunit protein bL32m n=1 Tax=Aquilegia coerulea TaxID=218851 RepID=A0A2G5F484_AQUCA|nr:hypothetical protein AQUCO_00200678v1 [Aquilegia coerulea]
MAFRITVLKSEMGNLAHRLSCRRWSHGVVPAPLANAMGLRNEMPCFLPEFNKELEQHPRFEVPSFSFGGCMELMAVPKKKISKHKRGIRNGPKALKPIPVIVRCKCCGRVKLPHFFCCSGDRTVGNSTNS